MAGVVATRIQAFLLPLHPLQSSRSWVRSLSSSSRPPPPPPPPPGGSFSPPPRLPPPPLFRPRSLFPPGGLGASAGGAGGSGSGGVSAAAAAAPKVARTSPNLRNNAISLFHGDYDDFGVHMADDEWKEYFDEHKNDKADEFDDNEMTEEERRQQQKALDQLEARRLQLERWQKNSQPKVFVPRIDDRGRAYGKGGRKTAAARVWIQPGLGHVVVNHMDYTEYFPRMAHRDAILRPFVVTDTCGQFDVQSHVRGGGKTGQAEAVRHGIARALVAYNPDRYRPVLKVNKLLTRDNRQVERKKIGHVKARKKPIWKRR